MESQILSIALSSEDIGKPLLFHEQIYYVDVVKSKQFNFTRGFILVDVNGNIIPRFENQVFGNERLIAEFHEIPPPRNLIDVEDLMQTPVLDLKDVYREVHSVLRKVVVFDDERHYDLVTAYVMYTWLRGLFPKNANLYVTGFPSTGKSQVARFIKALARYPIDFVTETSKSLTWYIAQTLGIVIIDEAEYLTKSRLAKLRRMHEYTIETRLVGLSGMGLTQIVLRVDAPIVISATHLPSDIAFLSRGFLIRMRYDKPEVKSIDFIEDVETIRLEMYRSLLANWFKVYTTKYAILEELRGKEFDERAKDISLPLMTILKLCDKDYLWVLEYAEKSIKQAFYATPENIVFVEILRYIQSNAKVIDGKYVIKYGDVYRKVKELCKETFASTHKVAYLLQYLYSGCEVKLIDKEVCFVCDKRTVDHVIELAKLD